MKQCATTISSGAKQTCFQKLLLTSMPRSEQPSSAKPSRSDGTWQERKSRLRMSSVRQALAIARAREGDWCASKGTLICMHDGRYATPFTSVPLLACTLSHSMEGVNFARNLHKIAAVHSACQQGIAISGKAESPPIHHFCRHRAMPLLQP